MQRWKGIGREGAAEVVMVCGKIPVCFDDFDAFCAVRACGVLVLLLAWCDVGAVYAGNVVRGGALAAWVRRCNEGGVLILGPIPPWVEVGTKNFSFTKLLQLVSSQPSSDLRYENLPPPALHRFSG